MKFIGGVGGEGGRRMTIREKRRARIKDPKKEKWGMRKRERGDKGGDDDRENNDQKH